MELSTNIDYFLNYSRYTLENNVLTECFCLEIDESPSIVYLANISVIYGLLSLALNCPPGSHYSSCAPACPQPSCQDPAGSSGSCNQPCVEGCFCDLGLILSGDKCVPLSDCGCTDEDDKYRPVSVLKKNAKRESFYFPWILLKKNNLCLNMYW